MKRLFSASILAVSVALFSCSNNSNSEDYNRAPAPGEQPSVDMPTMDNSTEPFAPAPDPLAGDQPAAQAQRTQQPQTGSVEHYICPAGHVGGGGDVAGQCSVCGAELAHNDAYHNQPAQNVNPEQGKLQPEITPANPVTPNTQPATNTAGVFHYICPDGHTGGSATQENCAVCGKQLVHNDKFHQ